MTIKIYNFWFLKEVQPKWFVKDQSFDIKLKELFKDDYQRAIQSDLEDLMIGKSALEILGNILLLDQIPRNIYRSNAQSFASDDKALAICKYGIDNKIDQKLPSINHQKFFYMPLMHSESLSDQQLSVKLFTNLGDELSTKFAIAHLEIIEKFGRFPHRNAILGRTSNKAEEEFLKGHNGF